MDRREYAGTVVDVYPMIEWNLFSPEYKIEEGSAPGNARWNIHPRADEKFVVKGSFQLGYPDGYDPFVESREWDGATVEVRLADHEYRRNRAMCYSQSDVISTATVPLMKALIERIHSDPIPTPTWQTIARQGGFTKMSYGDGYQMKLKKGYIEITARKGEGIWVTYQENRRNNWWNILILDAGSEKTPNYFPHPIQDMVRLLALFTVDTLVDFVKETQFHVPQPRAPKKMGDLMKMMERVDEILQERGRGDQRDYSRHSGFNFKAHGISLGVPPERADAWYRTPPLEMSPDEQAISEQCREAKKAYEAAHPYRDYWHFMLDHLPNFENDIKMKICFQVFADEAKEDWQKEIAQIYIDEFGAKEQVVKVSW